MYSKLEELRKKQALRLMLVVGKKPEDSEAKEKPEEKMEAKGEDKVVPIPKNKRHMVANEADLGKETDK